MELQAAIELLQTMINDSSTHCDYTRTVELAAKYKKLITGEKIDSLLVQFVQREDLDLFKQRCNITKAITPAVASSIRTPFNKVTRNDRVQKKIDIENEARVKTIETMVKTFYGTGRKQEKGLEYWLRTRFVDLTFSDPNSWVVMEWAPGSTASEILKPYPFEVPAAWAKNFYIVNNEVQWLFVEQPITFMGLKNKNAITGNEVKPVVTSDGVYSFEEFKPNERYSRKNGCRFTLYEQEHTIIYEEVDLDYLKETQFDPQGSTFIKISSKYYLVTVNEHKIGYAPVFRIGYVTDQETDARTFVNPWHVALCFFEKSLKTVSELDITMTMHTFPQKIQYVQKCPGVSKTETCNAGLDRNGNMCRACKGTGLKVSTSAQDAIFVPMPESKEEQIDIEKLVAYKSPPIDTVKFQNDYVLQLEQQAHRAVFNSQVFSQASGPAANTGSDINSTATGAEINMSSYYDALAPFADKFAELYREFVISMAVLAGENSEDVTVIYQFPKDFKLKTTEMLLGERTAATAANAPDFVFTVIDDDLANIAFASDPYLMMKYRVQSNFYPFPGKSFDDVTTLLASSNVTKYQKILVSNFTQIFKDIELETPNFYSLLYPAQVPIVEDMVEKYIETLSSEAPTVDLFGFRANNPATADNQNAGNGNEGSADNTDAGVQSGTKQEDNNTPPPANA